MRSTTIRRANPALLLSLSLSLTLGCAKQAEGDRCDTRNDNDDCESGLVCKALSPEGAICCPRSEDIGSGTVAACKGEGNPFDTDAGTSPSLSPSSSGSSGSSTKTSDAARPTDAGRD